MFVATYYICTLPLQSFHALFPFLRYYTISLLVNSPQSSKPIFYAFLSPSSILSPHFITFRLHTLSLIFHTPTYFYRSVLLSISFYPNSFASLSNPSICPQPTLRSLSFALFHKGNFFFISFLEFRLLAFSLLFITFPPFYFHCTVPLYFYFRFSVHIFPHFSRPTPPSAPSLRLPFPVSFLLPPPPLFEW